MIFSLHELKRLAGLDNKVKLSDINNAINSLGFEVESNTPFGNVSGIKFGKVLKLEKNPNADTLTVVDLEFEDKNRVIQTNATNLKVGDVVVAFVPGSSRGDITFGAKELQGIMSEGMLTSLGEYGIDKELVREEYEGIMTYNDVTDLSMDPVEYLGLRDILIDIDVLSNRSDAQSYMVMANEIAAYFKVEMPKLNQNKSSLKSNIKIENGKSESLVMMESTNDFSITIKEQILLAKSGIKSINDIVDLTNLTLIMTGQPTHAYDKDSVGKNFTASLSSDNVVIFGGKEVAMKNNLVIKSDDKVVSMAGVIGLENTGVNKETKDFVLELGIFNGKDIRSSMKKVKLSTRASIQSSKNFGYGTTKLALEYLSSKLNTFSEPVNTKKDKVKELKYNVKSASILAGFDMTKHEKWNDVVESLELLGFKFLVDLVQIPSYRYDIESYQDLNEEIFRFFGYNTFEPKAPKLTASPIKSQDNIKTRIAARGYNEVVTYSLISKVKNVVNPFDFKETTVLETFVSKEREVIRSSQAISLLDVIEYNQKRGMNDVSIFAEGMIGNGLNTFAIASSIRTFEEMKSDVVNLLPSGIIFKRMVNKDFHEGVSAQIFLGDENIGWIGKVHPSHSTINAFIAEFTLENAKYISKVSEYSNDPLKTRDVTYELSAKQELGSHIEKDGAFSVKVIDEFKKEDINKVTVRYTLSDEQIEKLK